ncbi:MAG: hypothetical protein ACKVOE_04250 [Rickettsiales bacterium]
MTLREKLLAATTYAAADIALPALPEGVYVDDSDDGEYVEFGFNEGVDNLDGWWPGLKAKLVDGKVVLTDSVENTISIDAEGNLVLADNKYEVTIRYLGTAEGKGVNGLYAAAIAYATAYLAISVLPDDVTVEETDDSYVSFGVPGLYEGFVTATKTEAGDIALEYDGKTLVIGDDGVSAVDGEGNLVGTFNEDDELVPVTEGDGANTGT